MTTSRQPKRAVKPIGMPSTYSGAVVRARHRSLQGREGDRAAHRVLYLIDHLSGGGAAQVVVNTALSLDRGKYEPIVCTTRFAPDTDLAQSLKEAGIELIALDRRSRGNLAAWMKLWRVLPSIDILHSHETGSNFWGRLWGRLLRVPVIITQDHTAANEKPRPSHVADRILSRLSDRIVAVSEFDRLLLIRHERLAPDKVITIYNGIDCARFDSPLDKQEARRRAGLPDAGFLIAVIARLAAQKNHALLFKAMGLLPEHIRSETECLVIGSGPLEASLRDLSYREGLDGKVSFLGERSDIPIVLRAIDLLVLPSHWECLPVVLLEALAAGTPVVATSVGGIPEIVQQLNWPLVDHTDPAALAAGIARVASMSASERAEMTKASKLLVKSQFTRAASTSAVEALYDSLGATSGKEAS